MKDRRLVRLCVARRRTWLSRAAAEAALRLHVTHAHGQERSGGTQRCGHGGIGSGRSSGWMGIVRCDFCSRRTFVYRRFCSSQKRPPLGRWQAQQRANRCSAVESQSKTRAELAREHTTAGSDLLWRGCSSRCIPKAAIGGYGPSWPRVVHEQTPPTRPRVRLSTDRQTWDGRRCVGATPRRGAARAPS